MHAEVFEQPNGNHLATILERHFVLDVSDLQVGKDVLLSMLLFQDKLLILGSKCMDLVFEGLVVTFQDLQAAFVLLQHRTQQLAATLRQLNMLGRHLRNSA